MTKDKVGMSTSRMKIRLKKGGNKTQSQKKWLTRQLNDPFVHAAKKEGYRSRAAFKLLELHEKYSLISKGKGVVDLGAAPGGWTQVAVALTGSSTDYPLVIGIDLQDIEPVPGAVLIKGDFLDQKTKDALQDCMPGPIATVMSDMAAASTGHAATDHVKIMALAESALHFALGVLCPGGAFVAKVLQGGTENHLLRNLKQHFAKVAHAKPKASRSDSREMYVVATGFKGQIPQ